MYFVGLLYQMLLPDKVTKIRGFTVSIATILEMSFDSFSSFKRQNYKNPGKKIVPMLCSIGSDSTENEKTSWPVFRQGLLFQVAETIYFCDCPGS